MTQPRYAQTDIDSHSHDLHTGSRIVSAIMLIALAGFALRGAARAADPKPDIVIKTRSVEATVLLESRIKADPAMAADCLAEGRKWAEKNRDEAEASRKQDPQMFRNGGWIFERKYDIRSVVAGHYISIVRSDYMNSGGAHPNSGVDTILWDTTATQRISIRPFFTETADGGPTMKVMQSAIIASLKSEKRKRDIEEAADMDWYKGVEPKLLKIGAVTLAPSTETDKSSGLTFHYPPYAVGPYAEGDYVAFVPWQKLKPYLTREGVAIFGGMRPRADDDQQ